MDFTSILKELRGVHDRVSAAVPAFEVIDTGRIGEHKRAPKKPADVQPDVRNRRRFRPRGIKNKPKRA